MLGGTLSPQHGASSGCGLRNGLQLWRVAANILNKQPRKNDSGWSSSLRVGRTSAIYRLQESLLLSEEESFVQYSHRVWGTHETSPVD
jgi:hypothetical protein